VTLEDELASLRKGSGPKRLSKFRDTPELAKALGTDEPTEMFERLRSQLTSMGMAHQRVADALANAYGFDADEPGLLTERRNHYAENIVEKHADTVEAWENEGIKELAARLQTMDHPPVDHYLYNGFFEDRRLTSEMSGWFWGSWDGQPTPLQQMTLYNEQRSSYDKSDGDFRMPCLIVELPAGHDAKRVTIAAVWEAGTEPARIVSTTAEDIGLLMSLDEPPMELDLVRGQDDAVAAVVCFDNVDGRYRYFALFWEY
jgi:hypothetical protein